MTANDVRVLSCLLGVTAFLCGSLVSQPAEAVRGWAAREGCASKPLAPTVAGSPSTAVLEGSDYAFFPTASDGNCDALNWSIVGQPAWADFNPLTGALTGRPPAGSAGTYAGISISVTDGRFVTAMAPFSISVTRDNLAPRISGTPAASVVAGDTYGFTPVASDPDGDVLRFTILNAPPWASFDAATGRLSGKPTEADWGEYVDIRITVTDGRLSTSLPAFAIIVELPNRAPVIYGTAAQSVTVGETFQFVPGASDEDGDLLTFSISNKPSWARFSTSTGELSGTPTEADVGFYSSIQIKVSDGVVTTALPAFAVSVEARALGSATLGWQPPTERTDGSALTDLAGYRIHVGSAPGVYGKAITVDNPGLSSYVVEGLTSGTWYFAVTAIDRQGLESDYSNAASKVIR